MRARFHEARYLRRLRRHGERAGLDAPGVQQVADQPAHLARLFGDDTVKFAPLGRVEIFLQKGVRGALDRGQRPAQLVPHKRQELRAHALDLVQRRQVLEGHHHRSDTAVLPGADRSGVDQRPHGAPARHE